MGIFDTKRELHKSKFREIVKKIPSRIPGFLAREKRIKTIEKVFPRKKFGSHISEQEYSRRIRELQIERGRARTGAEKLEKDRLIRYLKELKG